MKHRKIHVVHIALHVLYFATMVGSGGVYSILAVAIIVCMVIDEATAP